MCIKANLANFSMGSLDGKLFLILIIKTRTEIGLFNFFCRPLCMLGRIVTCLLSYVSSLKALENFDKPKEYIAFWS